MDFCSELATARREAGLSQEMLASALGVPRLRIARLEAGIGSVELLLDVMKRTSLRLTEVAKGDTLAGQLRNARLKRGWSLTRAASETDLDARTVEAIETGRGSFASLLSYLSAVAPRARRQPVTRALWDYDRANSSEADSRFTPKAFLDEVVAAFGEIHLDPCSHAHAPIEARRKIILPEDGLAADWTCDGLVWINPPFSDLAPWLAKANAQWESGAVRKMIFLLPASRLDLRSYFDAAAKMATTLILRERLRFASVQHPEGLHRAPFALTLVCWGCRQDEIRSFRERVPALEMTVT